MFFCLYQILIAKMFYYSWETLNQIILLKETEH